MPLVGWGGEGGVLPLEGLLVTSGSNGGWDSLRSKCFKAESDTGQLQASFRIGAGPLSFSSVGESNCRLHSDLARN